MSGSPVRDPLVPGGVDLRHFRHMLVDVMELREGDLAVDGDPTENWFAMILRCAAWHQLPAGSLPNDDAKLCRLAGFGRDVRAWARRRAGALRGWEVCSDGRLYHPAVAEKVMQAAGASRAGRKAASDRWTPQEEQPIEKQQYGECDRSTMAMPRREEKGREEKEESPTLRSGDSAIGVQQPADQPASVQAPAPTGRASPRAKPAPIGDQMGDLFGNGAVVQPPAFRAAAEIEQQFAIWWKQVPRKDNKQAALQAYRNAVKHTSPEQLLVYVMVWAERENRRPATDKKWCLHPSTWLNGRRWNDETAVVPSGETDGQPGQNASTRVDVDRDFTPAEFRTLSYDDQIRAGRAAQVRGMADKLDFGGDCSRRA